MTMPTRAIALFCFSLLLFCSYALVSPGSSNVTADELMLLSFKSMFASAGSLASWNSSSHYCSQRRNQKIFEGGAKRLSQHMAMAAAGGVTATYVRLQFG